MVEAWTACGDYWELALVVREKTEDVWVGGNLAEEVVQKDEVAYSL